MASITVNLYYQAPSETLADLCISLASVHCVKRKDKRMLPQNLVHYFLACAEEIKKGKTTGSLQREQHLDEIHIMPYEAAQIISRQHPNISNSELMDLAEERYHNEGDAYRFNIVYNSIDPNGLHNTPPIKTLNVTMAYNRGHSLELPFFGEELQQAQTEQEKARLIANLLKNQTQMSVYTLNLANDIFYPKDQRTQLLAPTQVLIRGWNIEPINGNCHLFENILTLQYKHKQ